jgi:hypothetical protein
MVAEFLSDPATVGSGLALGATVALALAIEWGYRLVEPKDQAPPSS